MNLTDPRYARFGLVADMLATPEIVAAFDAARTEDVGRQIAAAGRLLLTGEGSSRIFPSKHAIFQSRTRGDRLVTHTESGLQSGRYPLDGWAVFAISNSGRTAEVVGLFNALAANGHAPRYSLTASPDSKLESLATKGFVLGCGKERAVAATKSVVEQALFCQAMLEYAAGQPTLQQNLASVAAAIRGALTLSIDPELVAKVARAGTVYFAGANDGVAEELTLKTNEITRKKADYLEGTYAAHGIEEVMNPDDVVVWIDPPEASEQKFEDVLVKGVGLTVLALADRPTRFPTIQVPRCPLPSYAMMAAGWNLLVEIGITLCVDLDKPVRARKVGNECAG